MMPSKISNILWFTCFILLLSACNTGQKLVEINTPQGSMYFKLADQTPRHNASFKKLIKNQYFDDFTFNRVIKNFVIQGGCPDLPEGFDEAHYLLDAEFDSSLKHVYGALGAGRDNNPDKQSAGCQFYIVNRKEGIPRLDGDYTIFGQLVRGWDVLESISNLPTDSLDNPIQMVPIKVRLVKK